MQVYTAEVWNWIQLNGFKTTSTEGFFFHHSFFQLIRFKRNVVQHAATTEVICPPGTTYLQYVGDNSHHDVATIDGKTTYITVLAALLLPMGVSESQTQDKLLFLGNKNRDCLTSSLLKLSGKKLPCARQTSTQPGCSKFSRRGAI